MECSLEKERKRKKGAEERKDNRKKKKRSNANFVKLGPKTVPQSSMIDVTRFFYPTVNHRTNVDTSKRRWIKNAVRIETQIRKKKKKEKRKKVNKKKKEGKKTHVKLLQKVEANRFQFTSSKLHLILSGIRSGSQPGEQKEKMAERKIKRGSK